MWRTWAVVGLLNDRVTKPWDIEVLFECLIMWRPLAVVG